MVGALTLRGAIAPIVLVGPINRDAFDTSIEKVQMPELRPGDIVHHRQPVQPQGAARARDYRGGGAGLRFLPPYSPDFKPIENAFAKLKALQGEAAQGTIGGLWGAIGRILDLFPPAQCANFLGDHDAPRVHI